MADNAVTQKTVSLSDKYDLAVDDIFVSGTQAILRMMLMQKARDAAAGFNTAGYATGYRGSPLGQVDQQMWRASKVLKANDIVFEPGLNEDLAATAVWGTQQAHLRGEGLYDGVFSIWYGKGPGVDRSGDVFRHGNLAGTAPMGGVLVLMGDDHTCESSTTAHQSDFGLVDQMIPILYPSGVQEIVDFGITGWEMGRFTGCWAGLKLVKDTVDTTASIHVHPERLQFVRPDVPMPPGGLNIRIYELPIEAEARLHDYKLPAVRAFARANRLDRVIFRGGQAPKLGIVTAGKSYLDVRQALDDLGIDEVKAAQLGLALYKVAMPWPLEAEGLREFARGLQKMIVVEEKRALIEAQAKEHLYGLTDAPTIVGKYDEHGEWLLPAKADLAVNDIALAIADRLLDLVPDEGVAVRAREIRKASQAAAEIKEIASRNPTFCSGCPHNTSTRIPDGSRGYAGIGCHYMVQFQPERNVLGYTQMGGEGANWVGERHFVKTDHVFQQIGDGTYNHSGYLAIRAAAASGANITYKVLYNDAVAMTGGQRHEGGMTVGEIVAQVLAEGAKKVVVVTDEPEKYPLNAFPHGVDIKHRDELDAVQRDLREIPGLTVMVYDQTCASEKRRRRKRGEFPDPAKRLFINDLVCEGCGDCSVQSNCVSIVPHETEFGRKRAIDQSSCNKDYSCNEGFCPSFVTVLGGQVRKGKGAAAGSGADFPALPEPTLPAIDRQYAIVVNGIGGTGVVTIGALVGMAAHIEGKGCGVLDMQGLAQKGGAVVSHIRIADSREDIQTIRVADGGADLILGCDMVVTGSKKSLATVTTGRTRAVVNANEVITSDFVRNADFTLPTRRLMKQIEDTVGQGGADFVAATKLATALLGDSIASNLFMLGYAYQQGLIPLTASSIEQAIALNGVAVEMNKRAFLWGRRAAHDLDAVADIALPSEGKAPLADDAPQTVEDIVARRMDFLTGYQDAAYARRYAAFVDKLRAAEQARTPGLSGLTEAVARNLFKLMAYKDEYEVARLHSDPAFRKKLEAQFEGDFKLQFNLAPPLLSRPDPTTGKIKKIAFGGWMMHAFRGLAALRGLRGGTFDIFGYTAERRMERRLIKDYEALLEEIVGTLTPANHGTAIELARIPEQIRGYGHVKLAHLERAKAAEAKLLEAYRVPADPVREAAE